jgi:hypothetical protein
MEDSMKKLFFGIICLLGLFTVGFGIMEFLNEPKKEKPVVINKAKILNEIHNNPKPTRPRPMYNEEQFFENLDPSQISSLEPEQKFKYRMYILNAPLEKYNKLDEIQQEMVIYQLGGILYKEKWENEFTDDQKKLFETQIMSCIKPTADDYQLSKTMKLNEVAVSCYMVLKSRRF